MSVVSKFAVRQSVQAQAALRRGALTSTQGSAFVRPAVGSAALQRQQKSMFVRRPAGFAAWRHFSSDARQFSSGAVAGRGQVAGPLEVGEAIASAIKGAVEEGITTMRQGMTKDSVVLMASTDASFKELSNKTFDFIDADGNGVLDWWKIEKAYKDTNGVEGLSNIFGEVLEMDSEFTEGQLSKMNLCEAIMKGSLAMNNRDSIGGRILRPNYDAWLLSVVHYIQKSSVAAAAEVEPATGFMGNLMQASRVSLQSKSVTPTFAELVASKKGSNGAVTPAQQDGEMVYVQDPQRNLAWFHGKSFKLLPGASPSAGRPAKIQAGRIQPTDGSNDMYDVLNTPGDLKMPQKIHA